MLERGINHRQVTISQFGFRSRGLERFHLFRLRIEANDLHLRHVAEVDAPLLIDIDLEAALSNLSVTALGDAVLHRFTRFWIESPDELGIKVRIPEVSLCIEYLVV